MKNVILPVKKQWVIWEAPSPSQIPLIDAAYFKNTDERRRHHQVQTALAEIRKLHEELNAALYAYPDERPTIHTPADAVDILKSFLATLDHEEMWVMLLDTRLRVISLVQLYKGNINSSQIRISEIFRQALLGNAPTILIAHNHPSGDVSPSPDDVTTTHAIVQAGKLLDIEVLDHLVIANGDYTSLKERGLGFN